MTSGVVPVGQMSQANEFALFITRIRLQSPPPGSTIVMIARFVYRHAGAKKTLTLYGTCPVPDDLVAGKEPIVLCARPTKCFIGGYKDGDEIKYDAGRFRVDSFYLS